VLRSVFCHINGRAYFEVFENNILMKVFGLEGVDITLREGKRKLQNEKHNGFYCYLDIRMFNKGE
jgi:hypothetical protein